MLAIIALAMVAKLASCGSHPIDSPIRSPHFTCLGVKQFAINALSLLCECGLIRIPTYMFEDPGGNAAVRAQPPIPPILIIPPIPPIRAHSA